MRGWIQYKWKWWKDMYEFNELGALNWFCEVTLCVVVVPPDRRVCTCLSRAILSHSRSCLLALSCRSSFLICSTCQAESRHCHCYAPTHSDDNYYETLSESHLGTTETTVLLSESKMLNNSGVTAERALVNWWAGFSCLAALHCLLIFMSSLSDRRL